MNEVKIALVGTGGYGDQYVRALLQGGGDQPYKLVGTIEPYPDKSPNREALVKSGIPNYSTLEQFFAESAADLTIVSSPIQFHCVQTCLALAHGSHVLCEKPLSATVEEALRMIESRDKAGKFVAIGFQSCYSKGIQDLKQDVIAGLFGKPKLLRTIVLWPRTDAYYARGWAGKKSDGNGNIILDSVANNATAHYIHNMFYILGHKLDQSALPSLVTAELYRANRIENYDTAAMRVFTEHGVELLYYGSHAVNEVVGANFSYEFEKADIRFDNDQDNIIASFHDGREKRYANPNSGNDKLWSIIAGVGDGDAKRISCGIEAAMSHTLCINAMQSAGEIENFPEYLVRRGEPIWNGQTGNYVVGLVDQLKACYDQAILPAEAGLAWAKAAKGVRLG